MPSQISSAIRDGSIPVSKLVGGDASPDRKDVEEVYDGSSLIVADEDTTFNSRTGGLRDLFSLLFRLIKGITGKPSSLTAPATTLEAASTHYGVKASDSALGHVRVGAGLAIDTDGILSATAVGASARASLVSLVNLDLTGSETVDGAGSAALTILLVNQTTASENGLWVANSSGAWARPAGWAPEANALVRVAAGASFANTLWMLSNQTPPTIGTSGLAYRRIDGKRVVLTFGDADFTIPENTGAALVVCTAPVTDDRTVTLPLAAEHEGLNIQFTAMESFDASKEIYAAAATGESFLDIGGTAWIMDDKHQRREAIAIGGVWYLW